jgi:hypothetical protein
MRRELLAFLLMAVAAHAAIQQSYIQTVSRNGSSVIGKTMQITIFSDQLTAEALSRMEAFCDGQARIDCSVDPAAKTITMSDAFAPGGYYEFQSDYGLPFIRHTVTVSKIPTDRFSSLLDQVLLGANVTSAAGGGSASAIDLRDFKANRENADLLRQIGANITYTVVMPIPVSSATCGNLTGTIDGSSATFDLTGAMEQSQPIVVESDELNMGYMVAIAGLIVIIALAVSFMGSKTVRKRG